MPLRLEAENLFLRHQLNIAMRRAQPRPQLRGSDRILLIWMTTLWPSLLGSALVVQPETILPMAPTFSIIFNNTKSSS